MAILKTEEEINFLRESNILVSKTLGELKKHVKEGVSTLELDQIAEDFIRSHGASPAFKGYRGFPATLCTSVNEQVVHGIPSDYRLKSGDVVSVDCGVFLNGYVGDTAYTYVVEEAGHKVEKLITATKEALMLGIEQAISGNYTGHIGYAVQKHVENNGFSVVRELVGHGIGTELHEPPEVPNYGRNGTGTRLQKGMVICIEPMINFGKKGVRMEKDGWTIRTTDKLPSVHFELAVAVNDKKPDILSTFEYIELN
jgi:methionyl aminopeptidase